MGTDNHLHLISHLPALLPFLYTGLLEKDAQKQQSGGCTISMQPAKACILKSLL